MDIKKQIKRTESAIKDKILDITVKKSIHKNNKPTYSTEDLENLSTQFKNENYDMMIKMRYKKFRTDYHDRKNKILRNKEIDLDAIHDKLELALVKADQIENDIQRHDKKSDIRSAYYINRNKVNTKYDKMMQDLDEDFKYKCLQLKLKWKYIIPEKFDI